MNREEATAKVIEAWTKAGSHPAYHFAMQKQLKREWPVLAKAIENLIAIDKEIKTIPMPITLGPDSTAQGIVRGDSQYWTINGEIKHG